VEQGFFAMDDDPVVEEYDVVVCKSDDLWLLSFPNRAEGNVTSVSSFVSENESSQHLSVMLRESIFPCVTERVATNTCFAVGILSASELRLASVANVCIAAPSIVVGAHDEKKIAHRFVGTKSIVDLCKVEGRNIVAEAAVAQLSLRDKARELFERCAVVTWTEVCVFCGESSVRVIEAIKEIAWLVRGVWIRKVWKAERRELHERAWRLLLRMFVESNVVERRVFVDALPIDKKEAQQMLEAVAWRQKREWILKTGPDISLIQEYPNVVVDLMGMTEKECVVGEATIVQRETLSEEIKLMSSLFAKFGVVGDEQLRKWADENRIPFSTDVLNNVCAFRKDAKIWTFKREVLEKQELGLGSYVFASLDLLCHSSPLRKKDLVEGFVAAGLAEPSETMYRKALKTVAVTLQNKWRLKTGDLKDVE
jgi:hypothetical protein